MTVSFPSPAELGAPPKYTDWRPDARGYSNQLTAVLDTLGSSKRFRGVVLPTGSGKTLYAFMAILLGTGGVEGEGRGLILTENRALQEQYKRDLEGAAVDVVIISGAENYPCPALEPGGKYEHLRGRRSTVTAANGPCLAGMPCKLRESGCRRYDVLREARKARIVITNYANWLAMYQHLLREGEEQLGDFEWLICDEFHAAPEAVSRAFAVEINLREIANILPDCGSSTWPRGEDLTEWSKWCRRAASTGERDLEDLKEDVRHAKDRGDWRGLSQLLDHQRRLRRIVADLDRAGSARGEWIVQYNHQREYVRLDPLWPGPYCERYLFRGIPNVVGMSATMARRTFRYVGVERPEDLDFFDYPSTFPAANRPVYVIPVVPVTWKMSAEDEAKWLSTCDTIIGSRKGVKFLIHSVSYDRAQTFLTRSAHRARMSTNRRGESVDQALFAFRRSGKGDDGFVSPAISTGFDIDECDLQIIAKIPFGDSRDKLYKARCKSDKEYGPYTAMIYIVQAVGRIVRSITSIGETFIPDWNGIWFLNRDGEYGTYAPRWFWQAVRIVRSVPGPVRRKKLSAVAKGE